MKPVGNRSTRRGRPRPIEEKAIAWNVQLASREFGVTREALLSRLQAIGWNLHAGNGKKKEALTTRHIIEALFGSEREAKTRFLYAKAEQAEIDTSLKRGEAIALSDVQSREEHVFGVIREELLSFDTLTSSQVDACLRQLAGLKKN